MAWRQLAKDERIVLQTWQGSTIKVRIKSRDTIDGVCYAAYREHPRGGEDVVKLLMMDLSDVVPPRGNREKHVQRVPTIEWVEYPVGQVGVWD